MTKATELAPTDPFNYLLLADILNSDYQDGAKHYQTLTEGPARDQELKKVLAALDSVIDAFAHTVALAEGNERHDILAVGALRVPAGAAGDPGFKYLGDREEELFDPFLDPARTVAGEDRRQFTDESFGEDDQLARAVDRPLNPIQCTHDPLPSFRL